MDEIQIQQLYTQIGLLYSNLNILQNVTQQQEKIIAEKDKQISDLEMKYKIQTGRVESMITDNKGTGNEERPMPQSISTSSE